MKSISLLVLLACPGLASAQQVRTTAVRAAEAPVAAPSFAVSSPAPIALTAPSLTAAAPSAPIFAAAPAAPSAVAAAADPVAVAPLAAPAPAPAADGQLRELSRPADPVIDAGRAAFDGGAAAVRASEDVVAGAAASGEEPARSRPVERASAPARSIPLRRRAAETAALGSTALGFQLITGIASLNLGDHAWFPALAGAFWTVAGKEMIAQLGRMRGFVIGGWQASHDQKMRIDYGTGKLKDIRGHKYGEDRYDVWAPGRVSGRERFTVDAAAVLLGLPWVLSSGPKAVAIYAASAAVALAARTVWRRFRPEPAPVDARPDFEPDR